MRCGTAERSGDGFIPLIPPFFIKQIYFFCEFRCVCACACTYTYTYTYKNSESPNSPLEKKETFSAPPSEFGSGELKWSRDKGWRASAIFQSM